MKFRPALTLVELMLVVSIVSLLSVGAIYSFVGSRQNQALKLSADNMAIQLRRAHIFSRESRDESSWGVRINNNTEYALMSRDGTSESVSFYYDLSDPTTFVSPVMDIWFDQVTGYTEAEKQIQIQSPRGSTKTINVSEYGVISIQ